MSGSLVYVRIENDGDPYEQLLFRDDLEWYDDYEILDKEPSAMDIAQLFDSELENQNYHSFAGLNEALCKIIIKYAGEMAAYNIFKDIAGNEEAIGFFTGDF